MCMYVYIIYIKVFAEAEIYVFLCLSQHDTTKRPP